MTAMDRKPGSREREGGRGAEGERKTESARSAIPRPEKRGERGGARRAAKGRGERDPLAGFGKHEEGRQVEGEATK